MSFRILLAVLFAFMVSCVDYLAPPVVAVNAGEKVLLDYSMTLAEIESRRLTDAINAADTAEHAKEAKTRIAARFHPAWVAYEKARAAWVIAKIATAEAVADESRHLPPNLARIALAVAELTKQEAEIAKAIKELSK